MTATTRIQKTQTSILDRLDTLLELAKDPVSLESRQEHISGWNVGEHLWHLHLVDASVLKHLEMASPPADLAGKGPTLVGRCMMFAGYIPRGKGKAPAFVLPRDFHPEQVEPALCKNRERLAALDLQALAANGALARHQVFGYLNGAQWLRFVDLHHHHHWKIIHEIRRPA